MMPIAGTSFFISVAIKSESKTRWKADYQCRRTTFCSRSCGGSDNRVKAMNLHSQELFCAVLVSALLGSCAGPNSNIATSAAATPRFAQAPADRPGLGTKWGETRISRAGFVDFARADQSHPAATA